MGTGLQLHVGSIVTSSNSELLKKKVESHIKELKLESCGRPKKERNTLLDGVEDSPHVLIHFKSF